MARNGKYSYGTFISIALTQLNEKRGGDEIFDELCSLIIKKHIDHSYLPSSGCYLAHYSIAIFAQSVEVNICTFH